MTIGQMLLAQKAARNQIKWGYSYDVILDDFCSKWNPNACEFNSFNEWLNAELETVQCTAKMGN